MLCKVLKAAPGLSVSTLRHSWCVWSQGLGSSVAEVGVGISIGTGDFPSAPLHALGAFWCVPRPDICHARCNKVFCLAFLSVPDFSRCFLVCFRVFRFPFGMPLGHSFAFLCSQSHPFVCYPLAFHFFLFVALQSSPFVLSSSYYYSSLHNTGLSI